MDLEQRPSGLVVPRQAPDKSARKYGPLEFRSESERKEAHKAFQKLASITQEKNGIKLPEDELHKAQWKAIQSLAEMLLGDDVDFEVLT